MGLAAIVIRLAILPLVPIPQPFIHDEFSYLLAADTFASGRLTNPTHPMWVHFESFHIIEKPSYMSMYFPAQGLLLAAGRVLFGQAWFGVLLSSGLMCAAICWMLQGWLPPGWALLGGMLAVVRLGVFSYWGNTYYGGAVAAAGGALVLGALPRLLNRPTMRAGVLMALGAIILANSRPYEGLLVCGPALVALLWPARAARRPVLFRRMLTPLALLLIAAGMMAYYNHRVFGHALTLPYQVNRAEYAVAPVFLWQTPRRPPDYHHKVMSDFYTVWELGDFRYARTLPGFVAKTAQKFATVALFFCGFALLAPCCLLARVLRDRRLRYLLLAGGVFGVGLSANAWLFPHYAAPFAAAIYVILLQGLRHLRLWRPAGQPIGLALVRFTVVACVLLAGVRLSAGPLSLALPRWPNMWYGTEPLGLPRAVVAATLARYPGRQLAIVRYAQNHKPFDDWVYNAADIDKSKVVWARDMDSANNCQLIRYFRDRHVWLVEPDFTPPKVTLYERSSGCDAE
ncbi:MAG TPA: hypothetical protein VEV17_21060 [Bryobacteraceae bacterium]|nr:hypothetical protein [Bryobacteraceae bacterium]